ncbi:MAG: response regulator [Oleiphilaceae bacterium]|nr:response regulator [Oleiphilaceae bacterium]
MKPEKLKPGPTPILMADDDAMDRTLTQEAFLEAGLTGPLYFVEDGEQLLHYLRGEGPYGDRQRFPMPGVVLLDLNMPRLDGWGCLKAIRHDPSLKHLPVVVMTTSTQAEEVMRSYRLGASSFLCKPLEFDQLVAQIRGFGAYWCGIVELPPCE